MEIPVYEKRIALKPCPFCGKNTAAFRYKFLIDHDCFRLFVKCTYCHAATGFVFDDENPAQSAYTDEAAHKCAELWNRRDLHDNEPEQTDVSNENGSLTESA